MIESRIWLIRGHKVLLDADLAELYQVETKRLNEAVRRNRDRFPEDFMFQLTGEEYELVGFAHTWGEQRVFFREPGQTQMRSLPASWTDVVSPDPFVVLADGRACFRPADLLHLVHLVRDLQDRCK